MAKTTKKPTPTRETVTQGDFAHATNGHSANRVWVCMAKTVNLGNYESLRVEFGQGRAVEDGESFAAAQEALANEVLVSLGGMLAIVQEAVQS